MMRHWYLLLAATAMMLSSCGRDEGAQLVVGELASDRIELATESSEPIVAISVAEGEAVSAGQLLLRQDGTRATARLADADATLAQAQARFDELVRGPRKETISAARANVAGAEDELAFRRADFARVQKIHEQNLVSADVLDRARTALDTAEATLDALRAQLQELLAGTTTEELAQAEAAVAQAKARRALAAVDVQRLEITAPVDGIVDSRLFEIGERPAQGQVVMVMLPAAQPYARVYIPEQFRARLHPGIEAVVHVDGIDEPIRGRLRWVASDPAFTPYYALTERDRGNLSYLAKVDLVRTGPRLPDGVPVQVELQIGDAP